MNTFEKRNALRRRQIEFADNEWVKQVGDRVQLKQDYEGYPAWSSGTITALTPLSAGYIGIYVPHVFATVVMENGRELREKAPLNSPRALLPIVPHEDYFKDDEGGAE